MPNASTPRRCVLVSFESVLVMESKSAVKVLSALAQESRLAIFRMLLEHAPEGLSVGTIGERLGVPNATLSHHLRELIGAGLLVTQQEGRFVYCAADISVMNSLMGFLTENCCKDNTGDCGLDPSLCVPKKAGKKAVAAASPRRTAATPVSPRKRVASR